MKKITRRIISIALATVFAVCMLTNSVFATNALISSRNTTTYLALGDSITAGFGLSDPDTECFVSLFGEEIGATTINYGVSGLTAATLSETLATGEYDTYLAMVDVVTITIGGNDLLHAFYQYLLDLYNTTFGTDLDVTDVQTWFTDGTSYQEEISTVMSLLTSEEGITEAVAAVSGAGTTAIADIQSIITYILSVNSDAIILLANQYNPYASLAVLEDYAAMSTLFDTAVTAFNALLTQVDAMSDNVVVVDVYSAGVATNVNLLTMNFDFHPNTSGHETIAAAMVAAYENATSTVSQEEDETETESVAGASAGTSSSPATGVALALLPMAIVTATAVVCKRR